MECDKRVSDVHASLFALKLQTQTHVSDLWSETICAQTGRWISSALLLSGLLVGFCSVIPVCPSRLRHTEQVWVHMFMWRNSGWYTLSTPHPLQLNLSAPSFPLVAISLWFTWNYIYLEVRMAWWFGASVRGILACLWNLHLLPIELVQHLCLWFSLHWRRVALEQGCPMLLLNGRHPAEFISGAPACKFLVILKLWLAHSGAFNYG